MSLGDNFFVTLPSNVSGPIENTPGQYETSLAKRLDLPGNWEVAITDISYPHTWLNIKKDVVIAISVELPEDEPAEFRTTYLGDDKSMELVRAHTIIGRYNWANNNENIRFRPLLNYYVKSTFVLEAGQYPINTLLEKIEDNIRLVGFGLQNAFVRYNKQRNIVIISNITRSMLVACYADASILPVLGFRNQMYNNKTIKGYRFAKLQKDRIDTIIQTDHASIDFLVCTGFNNTEALLPPLERPIKNIFVYADINNYVLVGNTQAAMLAYFPVQTEWGDQGYWNFNPPYPVRVNQEAIDKICVKLCDDKGQVIEFKDGDVICRLNFRRVGVFRDYF